MSVEKSPQQLLEEQYQDLLRAVKPKDEEALAAQPNQRAGEFQTVPYEAPLLTKSRFNQVVLWVAGEGADKLATSLLSTIPVAGALAPGIKWALARSLELPKEDQDILNEKLDVLSGKLEVLRKEVKESVDLINCSANGAAVEKIKGSIDTLGRNLMFRKETNDPKEFAKIIADIGLAGDNGMYAKLAYLDTLLVGDSETPWITNDENEAVNQPLLYKFRDVLQARITDTDRAFFYDIVDYQRDMKKWLTYVKGIQVKGNSLLVMEQLYKLVESRCAPTYPKGFSGDQDTIVETIRRYNDDLQNRIRKYEKVLYEDGHGIMEWESCKLLLRASKVNLDQQWPTLYRLEHTDTEGCLQIQDGQGWTGYGTLEGGQRTGRTEYSSAFGFVRWDSTSSWGLRGSRFSIHPQDRNEAHLQRAGAGNDSQWGLYKGVKKWDQGTKLHIKVVPKFTKPGEDPRVTLVFLSESGKEAKKKYDVHVRETGLPLSLAFIDPAHPSAEPPKLTANYPFHGFAQVERYCSYNVGFQIQNLTKPGHVLVLQDVRGSMHPSGFRTHGTVWLNQQRSSVGLLSVGDGTQCAMKFKLFRLLNSSHNGQDRSHVEYLLFIDPETGKLSLRKEGAAAIADIFVRIDNPAGLWRNYVSATAFNNGVYSLAFSDLHTGDYDYSKLPNAVTAELDANAQVQGSTWAVSRANVGLAYTISSGAKPTGEITISSVDS
ncbi:hypothetical protein F4808DRAFT_469890 [Astrocystis sublimbata]|nr:hypothetical protein F4808DRAFT_469890 [Astrocystis sublimbata]